MEGGKVCEERTTLIFTLSFRVGEGLKMQRGGGRFIIEERGDKKEKKYAAQCDQYTEA